MPPTITVGAAAPAGSTVSIAGEDSLGRITLTVPSPADAGIVFEVKFGNAYSEAPGKVTVIPVSFPGAAPTGTVNISAGIWQLDSAGVTTGTYEFVYKID